MAELPRGTVTLVFTDIEGSTRLLENLGESSPSTADSCARPFPITAGSKSTPREMLSSTPFLRPTTPSRERSRPQRTLASHRGLTPELGGTHKLGYVLRAPMVPGFAGRLLSSLC